MGGHNLGITIPIIEIMNKAAYTIIILIAATLHAELDAPFRLNGGKLIELKHKAFQGDKEASVSMALHYDYVCNDGMLSSIWYYIAYRNGSALSLSRINEGADVSVFIKNFPVESAKRKNLDKLTISYIEYLHNLSIGEEDEKLRNFLKSNGVKNELLTIPDNYTLCSTDNYALTQTEIECLPNMALKGHKKAAERAFKASIYAGSAAPKYSPVLGYICAVLNREAPEFMKSGTVKKAYNISKTNDIFSLAKQDIEELSKRGDAYSNFILFQYYKRNNDAKSSEKYYNILKKAPIDDRFLEVYDIYGEGGAPILMDNTWDKSAHN